MVGRECVIYQRLPVRKRDYRMVGSDEPAYFISKSLGTGRIAGDRQARPLAARDGLRNGQTAGTAGQRPPASSIAGFRRESR